MRRLLLAVAFIATTAVAAPWTSHGPRGGVVTQLAVAATNRDVIWVIAPDGVFRTADAGAAWSNISGPIGIPNALTISGTDSAVVAAANGVFRTDDAGATWQSGGAGLPAGAKLSKLIADPRDPNVLYVTSNNCFVTTETAGIFRSADGGRSFTAVNVGGNFYERCVTGMALDPLSPDRIYMSWAFQDISGAKRSDDGGQHWSAQSGPERAVVGRPSTGQRYGINTFTTFSTSPDGVNWTSPVPIVGIAGATALRYNALALDPVAGRLFLGTSDGAYRSGNGGLNWLRLGGAAVDPINSLDFDSATGAVVIGTNFGVFRSAGFPWNDWSNLQFGNAAMPIGQVIADPAGADIYALSQRHLFRSRDFGKSWDAIGDPLANPQSAIVVDAGHQLYSADLSGSQFHIRKLSAEGHWEEVRTLGPVLGGLVADPREAGRLYSFETNAIALTRDGGATWQSVPLPSSPLDLSIDPRNSDSMIMATLAGMLRSVDGGHSWTAIDVPQYWTRFWIVRAPSNPDVLYMYARDGKSSWDFVLTRSTDGGQTWTTLPKQPVDNDGIARVAIDPRNADTIYAPTANHGLVRSTDAGRSWQSINDGLPENHGASLAVDSRGAFLHAATFDRGVWELPLAQGRERAVRK